MSKIKDQIEKDRQFKNEEDDFLAQQARLEQEGDDPNFPPEPAEEQEVEDFEEGFEAIDDMAIGDVIRERDEDSDSRLNNNVERSLNYDHGYR